MLEVVDVTVDDIVYVAFIEQNTYEILRDGALLRQRPLEYYLAVVVREYGALTNENILKFMKERWVL